MNFDSHFELALEKIPQGGFLGTLDMLLPDVYCFICQIQPCAIYFRVGACNLLQGLHYYDLKQITNYGKYLYLP